MLTQLFRLATREPEVLAEHVEAYSELVAEELHTAATRWKRHLVLKVVAWAAFLLAGLLLTISLLLWAVVPVTAMNEPWALIVVPLIPAIVGLWAARSARKAIGTETFATLRYQWAADRGLLRELTES